MHKIIHLQANFKALEDDESLEDVIIEGKASTDSIDRVGDVIEASAWSRGLKNFRSNPIILFNHDANRPIGKALTIKAADDGLHLKAKISKIVPDVVKMIREGILKAFSVGFKINDAEWDDENRGLRIKSAELLEVSVVSVPANQSATFSVAKSFDTQEEYDEYIKTLNSVNLAGPTQADKTASVAPEDLDKVKTQEIEMDPKDLEALIGKAVKEATAAVRMEDAERKAAEEKAAKEVAEKAKAEEEQKNAISVTVTTAAEKLLKDVEERFNSEKENWNKIIEELQGELKEKSSEISAIRESRSYFPDRRGKGDWREVYEKDVLNAAILGVITKKGLTGTDFGQDIVTKVNQHSGVEVPSADFEQLVSTTIERDVELALVLGRLFREIPMSAAAQFIPLMPDADYAQFANGTNGDTSDSGSAPRGNLDARGAASPGANAGIAIAEKILSVKRVISKSYLGNETEEDAILPVLPLIREAMVRSHARAMEQAILNGGINAGSPSLGVDLLVPGWEGLIANAQTDSKTVAQGAVAIGYTAAHLMDLRQAMGKYGRFPQDVIFVVSLDGYYGLLDDPEFQDANLVGSDRATKIHGEIGQVYGSPVIVCDEFTASASNVAWAVALNPRNYVMPRLRGFTMEQDYVVEDQRRVLVASQRVGFDRLFSTAGQVVAGYYTS